jgi:hypothetical protein
MHEPIISIYNDKIGGAAEPQLLKKSRRLRKPFRQFANGADDLGVGSHSVELGRKAYLNWIWSKQGSVASDISGDQNVNDRGHLRNLV